MKSDRPFLYFYGSPDQQRKRSKLDSFEIYYQKCDRPPRSFREEAILIAQKLNSLSKNDTSVMFSGGVDSEFVLRSFLEAGVSPRPVFVRLSEKLNIHEEQVAFETLEELKLTPTIVELDIEEIFFSKRAFPLLEDGQSAIPTLVIHFFGAVNSPSFPVFAHGEPFFERRHDSSQWDCIDEEIDVAVDKFMRKRKIHGSSAFFWESSEILLAYLKDPFVINKMQQPEYKNSNDFKADFYNQVFPMRNKKNHGFNGFERLVDLFCDYHPLLHQRYGNNCYAIRKELLESQLDPDEMLFQSPLGKEWRGYQAEDIFSSVELI